MKPGDMLRHPQHPNDRLEVVEVKANGDVEAASLWHVVIAPADEFESWFRAKGPPDALDMLGEARGIIEAVIAADPSRAAKGSIANRTGLGGTLHHIEFAMAELVESLTAEELAAAAAVPRPPHRGPTPRRRRGSRT